MPLSHNFEGKGECGLGEPFALPDGTDGNPVDTAVVVAFVVAVIPGADGADGAAIGGEDQKTAAGDGGGVGAEFTHEEAVGDGGEWLGIAPDIFPQTGIGDFHGADGESFGEGDVGDVVKVWTLHNNTVVVGWLR